MKITRRTKLLVVALVLCMTTMIGSTLAWFTDTVESGVNTIEAGNLDIELAYWDGDSYEAVTKDTKLFKENVLWEPGHTEVAYLKITNAGNLALNYKLNVNISAEASGINVAGDTFKLSDYIKFKVAESDTAITPYTTRDDAIAAATATPGSEKSMTTQGDVDYVALVAYMPTTVGNEANPKTGTTAPSITLGVKLEAKQAMHETDGFNTNDYDKDAQYLEVPFAKVTVLNADDTLTNADGDVTVVAENLTINTTDSKLGLDVGQIPMGVLYQFEPTMSPEDGNESKYADWHADFVVSVDKDIPAYGIGLAGYYDAWCSMNDDKWVMMASSDPIEAGTEIRLIKALLGEDTSVAYSELCKYGNDGIGFLCGAVALVGKEIDGEPVNALTPGTTITVELRLYEATGASTETEKGENDYVTAGVYAYTFK